MRARLLPAVLLATAMLLSGCGKQGKVDGPIELVLWKNQAGLDEEAATNAAIERFNKAQDRWHVSAQSLPQGAYSQQIVAASLAGRMPCIMAVDNPQLARFVWAGHLQPLSGHIPADLAGTVNASAVGQYRGTVYSLGQFDAALAIFTRRSTLASIGARVPTIDRPWTGEEFQAVLEKLKASGRYRYPLDLSTRDTKADWWTYAFAPMLQSFGGDLIDPATRRTAEGALNGNDALRFGQWFQNLFDKELVNRMEPDEYGFVSGRSAMVYTGNWWTPDFRKAAGDDLLVLPPPDFGHGAVIGGGSWQWAISRTCPHADGAGAFISFLMQPREIAAMSDAIGLIPATAAGAALSRDYGPNGQNRIFYELSLKFARQRPETPAFTGISNAFYRASRDIMDGKDVHDALDDAVDDIDVSLADSGGAQ